ncbi:MULTISPECIES: FKBP-type peptidyl-prolyl cis-trans isomerase [unclassified Gilliamella]|uniref:FKBP-type peptidyl-prolyl cis-trans isomerase n=1 Tax=unclassified Gilliamella TaxID=2685620 RepID=UPI00132662CB|nr:MULTISPECIES: FKBP-type peptidyl-prolyl cis-trans isomerase [unclassified Gilliamella]MWN31899.1 FKBP-type peptidyl-prolyl cis-trans isomerase [Gilliamella sp. Pra-s60]MWP29179.1 FKBP-type peptidyl-prolyl cis-trans isomerase [Gilliamella sp. Pra-s54]
MKSLIKMTLISSAIILTLAGCDDKKSSDTSSSTIETNKTTISTDTQKKADTSSSTTETNKITISTDAQKEAYALGSSFATFMKTNLERNEVEADQKYLISGFNETFNGASQLNENEVKTILDAFDKRIQKESRERFEKQKIENTATGNKFREEFAKQDGVKKTKSGLLYKILENGSEQHPTESDTVIVHYTGTLTDGRKFDSSYDRSEPVKFPLNGVIKGWIEGIQLIGVGGKIKLVVPPDLGYGDQNIPGQEGKAGIQPASTLVFEVELLGIDSDKNDTNEEPMEEQAE